MAIATLKKSLTVVKKGSQKKILKILNIFQGVWLGNVIFQPYFAITSLLTKIAHSCLQTAKNVTKIEKSPKIFFQA